MGTDRTFVITTCIICIALMTVAAILLLTVGEYNAMQADIAKACVSSGKTWLYLGNAYQCVGSAFVGEVK
jgi:hypothetical protein